MVGRILSIAKVAFHSYVKLWEGKPLKVVARDPFRLGSIMGKLEIFRERVSLQSFTYPDTQCMVHLPLNYPNAGSLEPHWLVFTLFYLRRFSEAGLDSHDIHENIHPSKTNMEPKNGGGWKMIYHFEVVDFKVPSFLSGQKKYPPEN